MIIRSFFKLALVLLISSSFIACNGKKNDPILNDTEKSALSEFKVEVEIVASKEVVLYIVASKGLEPNIYRDGKIVSEGKYESGAKNMTNLKTTLSHKGRELTCSFSFFRTVKDESSEPIHIKTKAKLYKNNKLIEEYENTKAITSYSDSTSEVFQFWGY